MEVWLLGIFFNIFFVNKMKDFGIKFDKVKGLCGFWKVWIYRNKF